MPSKAILAEKTAVVDALAERLNAAQCGVLVDYRGLNVAEDTELRRSLRADGIEYTVVKNTLTRLAMAKIGLSGMEDSLNGTTALATSASDPIAPLHILSTYSKKFGDKFNIKNAFLEGRVLTESEIAEMAVLPSKDALYSKVLGTLIAPITSLAVVLGQILEQKGGSVEAPAAE